MEEKIILEEIFLFNETYFFDTFWAKQYFYQKGEPNKFDKWFTSDEYFTIVEQSATNLPTTDKENPNPNPSLRLFKNGVRTGPIEYIIKDNENKKKTNDIDKIKILCENGATLIIDNIMGLSPNLYKFLTKFAIPFRADARINSYYTFKPNSQGFSLHRERHDVIILQILGHKQWQVGRNNNPEKSMLLSLPPADNNYDYIDLNRGDALYIPRGTWHTARTIDKQSLHLTIGIHSKTGIDFILWLIDKLKKDENENFLKNRTLDVNNVKEIISLLRKYIAEPDENELIKKFLEDNKKNFYINKPFRFPLNS